MTRLFGLSAAASMALAAAATVSGRVDTPPPARGSSIQPSRRRRTGKARRVRRRLPRRNYAGAGRRSAEARQRYLEICLEQVSCRITRNDGRVLTGDAAVHELFRLKCKARREKVAAAAAARKRARQEPAK
ncbi:MAG: hypothetical protein WD341_06220 [Tistlia sp.]|uniref:hypothetical protein n=1 Tax=Tistlia sp. TaxID=3057121 RepID=UPI0034A2888C